MNLISTNEAINVIGWTLYWGIPIIIILLIWIGLTLRKINKKINLK